MKLRLGFVSNSSSSSFVGFILLEDHEQALEQLDEQERKYIDSMDFEFQERFGKKWVCLSECYDNGGGGYINGKDRDILDEISADIFDPDEVPDDWPYDTYEKYSGLLKGEILSHGQDW